MLFACDCPYLCPDFNFSLQLTKTTKMNRILRLFQQCREELRSANKVYLLYVLVILFNTVTFSLAFTIFSVSMVDLRFIYDVDTAIMPKLMMALSFGYAIGTLVGPLYKWLNRQLVVGISAILFGAITAFQPLYHPIIVVFIVSTVQGICTGVYCSSLHIWFQQMFPSRLNALLSLNQFGFGLGSMAAPVIAGFFLYGKQQVEMEVRKRSLVTLYAVIGLFEVCASSLFLILFVTRRYRKVETEAVATLTPTYETFTISSNENHLEQATTESPKPVIPWRRVKLTLCTFMLGLYYAAECGYLTYGSAMWQNQPAPLNSTQAAYVQTVLSTTYTIGPVVTAFISMKISPDTIISYHFGLMFIGLGMLYFAQMNMAVIYVGSAIFGYCMSAMIATIYAFVDRHFTLNNRVTTAFSLTNAILTFSVSGILAEFTMAKYPNVLFNITLVFMAISLALFVVLRLWITFFK